jgi:hypothetical protein
MTFTKVENPLPYMIGDAVLYQLSESVTWTGITSSFVVRSIGLETLIDPPENYGVFLADENGRILSWANLAWEENSPPWVYDLE